MIDIMATQIAQVTLFLTGKPNKLLPLDVRVKRLNQWMDIDAVPSSTEMNIALAHATDLVNELWKRLEDTHK